MANASVLDSGNWNFNQMPLSWIVAFDKNSIAAIMDNGITHYFGQ